MPLIIIKISLVFDFVIFKLHFSKHKNSFWILKKKMFRSDFGYNQSDFSLYKITFKHTLNNS